MQISDQHLSLILLLLVLFSVYIDAHQENILLNYITNI